jgi:hypothetical protein
MASLGNEDGVQDEQCAPDPGWERVEVSAGDKREKQEADAYIVQQVAAMRPSNEEQYQEPRRSLPHPCMQAVGSALLANPTAWVYAGISVLYVAWHLIPQLVQLWKQQGMPEGMPPCPSVLEQGGGGEAVNRQASASADG